MATVTIVKYCLVSDYVLLLVTEHQDGQTILRKSSSDVQPFVNGDSIYTH